MRCVYNLRRAGGFYGRFPSCRGHKGQKRYALPNSEIMIHQPMGGAQGQASDIAIVAEHILKIKKKLNEILAERTGQPLERIEKDTDRDNYMSAQGGFGIRNNR